MFLNAHLFRVVLVRKMTRDAEEKKEMPKKEYFLSILFSNYTI